MACICTILIVVAVIVSIYVLLERRFRKGFIQNIAGKCVLITGTDSGFGRKLTLDLDKLGVIVYAGCYTDDGLVSLRNEGSSNIKTFKMDVTSEESLKNAKSFVQEDLTKHSRKLWGLVNNAGVMRGLFFPFATLKTYKENMDVNFFGTIRTCETFVPLIKQSHGRIVNIISLAGRVSYFVEAYTCSKYALEPYTDGLRRHMKQYGVHVACIEPGLFRETNMTNKESALKVMESEWKSLPQDLMSEYGEELHLTGQKGLRAIIDSPITDSGDPGLVTNAITHALLAKHPKSRYRVGRGASLAMFAPFAPDWLADFVIIKITNWFKL